MDNKKGVTLVELLIAIALIGVGILVSVKTFNYISKSTQFSKDRTLATSIAQEKMQILMQKSYYEVLVTRSPAFKSEGDVTITYDTLYYPPEPVTEGGITFTRYTYIEAVIENSGAFAAVPPTTPDTGMRQITETVIWPTDTGDKFLVLKSVLNNPNTVMANSVLSGVVKDSTTLTAIPNALVNASENIGWQDTTSASGAYLINLSPGTFNFRASAPGYYSKIIPQTLPAYGARTQDFYLIRVSSGAVKGTAWIDNHLVISQVVASTGPAKGIEYVELYNPTTAPFNMGTNLSPTTPSVWPVVFDAAAATNAFAQPLVYISTYIPSHGFFLISNTGTGAGDGTGGCAPLTILATTVNPDACWYYVGMPKHALQCNPFVMGALGGCLQANYAGGIGIGTNGGAVWSGMATATKYDSIAWTGNGAAVPMYSEGAPAPSAHNGMDPGETFLRRLDTTTAWNNGYGNAYDSDYNSVDFIDYGSPQFPPRTSATRRTPVTGSPAFGAIVSVTDSLSLPSSATVAGVVGSAATPPYAQFSVPGVATGTWTVFIDSGQASAQIDGVTIANSLGVWVPNNATTPPWTMAGSIGTVLSNPGVVGVISGTVTDALGVPLNGITVTAGTYSTTTNSNGTFVIRLATGTYDVTANPGNSNAIYASMTWNAVPVTLGDVTVTDNFALSQGGKISGWVTCDGVNPLPGVSVIAQDVNLNARDNEITGSDGRFLLTNLSTGPYTVQAILDFKELSTPATIFASVSTPGLTVFCGTFTVTGALGTVTGSVTLGGKPLQSGVLVVVATGTLSTPLPAISSTTASNSAYYAGSSKENGTYSVDVRGDAATFYTVSGYYMHMNGGLPIISSKTVTNVTVTAGQTTPGINFAW